MIKSLRKRHLQIWSLWALLLPVGIISATIARKSIPPNQLVQVQNGKALPVVIAEKAWKGDVVQLRGNNKLTIRQLIWINKQPLHVPSATIYIADSDIGAVQNAQYIGRIESRGNYAFDLIQPPPANHPHLIVYDFIHKQIIDRINF